MDVSSHQWTVERGWTTSPASALDSPDTLVLVFGSGPLDLSAGPLGELRSAYPQSTMIGCSTAGEIFGETVAEETVTTAIVRFSEARVRLATTPIEDACGAKEAGMRLASELRNGGPDLRGIFVLSDGLNVNGSLLAEGLRHATGASAGVLSGGLAGDGDRFGTTWVLVDGEPRTGWISAVGLYGDSLELGYGCEGGWDIFGPERKITRSAGNVLHELDGQPALTLYKNYLGDRAAGLPATALLFPLALREPGETSTGKLVRTILAIDEEAQTMTFAGDVPQGSFAQLMRANIDRLVDGARDAAEASAPYDDAGGPTLAIAVSCVGRRLILGQDAEAELEAVSMALPHGTTLVGFYSYGELSPTPDHPCELHNQTMTVTTLRERPPQHLYEA